MDSSVGREWSLEKVVGEGIAHAWPALERVLVGDPSMWEGLGSLEAIKAGLFSGGLQLWVLMDEDRKVEFMLLTQLVHYSEFSALRVVWAFGHDPKKAVPSCIDLEYVARSAGCKRLEVIGRGGWEKMLKPLGYTTIIRVFGRDLDVMPGRH